MPNGDIFAVRIPVDLDYLALADTALTNVDTGPTYSAPAVGTLTVTMVDVSGRNSVRKVVVVVTARAVI